MKRGRKQDDTLPPSRSRDVQRAFRARRAAYISNLEQRVKELEEENAALKARVGESSHTQKAPPQNSQFLTNSSYYPSTTSGPFPPRRNTVGTPTTSYASSSYFSTGPYNQPDGFATSLNHSIPTSTDQYNFSGQSQTTPFWCASPTFSNSTTTYSPAMTQPNLVPEDPLTSGNPSHDASIILPPITQQRPPPETLRINMHPESVPSSSDSSPKVKQEEKESQQQGSSSNSMVMNTMENSLSKATEQQTHSILAKSIPTSDPSNSIWAYQPPAAPFQTPPTPRSETPPSYVSCPLAWSIFSQIQFPNNTQATNSDILSLDDVRLMLAAIETVAVAEHESIAVQAIQRLIEESGNAKPSSVLFAKSFIRQLGQGIKVSVRLLDEALKAMGCSMVDWGNVGRYGVASVPSHY